MNDYYRQFLICSGHDCLENDRFQNNFANGRVDHVSYRNVSIEQRPEVIDRFEDLILSHNPATIIEIGTFAGGLTLILKDIVDYNNLSTIIHTYDTAPAQILIDHKNQHNLQNLHIHTTNLFNDSYNNFKDDLSRDYLAKMIQSHGKTIVLCDGGCKKCEFNMISDLIKPDDIIMAHDYAPDSTYFGQHMLNKIWNWHEIQDSDVQDSVSRNSLKKIEYFEFLSVAWLCMTRANT